MANASVPYGIVGGNVRGMTIANLNLLDGAILARDGATGTAVGNVTTASPALFVNPSAADLRLKATAAAAIDRVAVIANCPADWEGESRPQGSAADVGADEYSPGAALSPPKKLRVVR